MTDETQKRAILLRLKQAQETLAEAEILLEHQFWRGAINRAYYAMFYAILALATSRRISISKHTHAIAFFDKEFIKTGIFSKEFSRSLHLGFDERQSRDYGEISDIEGDEVQTAVSEAKALVGAVDDYLKHAI